VVYGSKICNTAISTQGLSAGKEGLSCGRRNHGDFMNLPITSGRDCRNRRNTEVLDAGHWAIGFRENGTAFIDKPALGMKVLSD
jgi:hypothetical protein